VVLPDTSIWVAYLRAGSTELTQRLNRELERGEVLVCGPVIAELAAGARPADRQTVVSTLASLPWAELGRREWQSVGLLAAELRDRGEVLPLTDLEIAVATGEAGATLWTGDRQFERVVALVPGLDLRLETTGEPS
jgi:predicted nucleic acid-binding protein